MKRIVLIAITIITVLSFGVRSSIAENSRAAAPAAVQPAAPAQGSDKPMETTGGCMPGGGCCGAAACAQAAGEHKPAGDNATAGASGGCPCSRNRKAKKAM